MAENQRFEIAARPHLAVDLLVANLSGTPCPVKAAAAEGGANGQPLRGMAFRQTWPLGWRQIAERFLSEGNGEAARIRGNRVRDLNKIQSEAYRKVEEIRGVADAKATEIYAKAYNQSPEAVRFYEFTRTMQAYKSIIADNTTIVLSTDSDLFKFLKGITPKGDVDPAQRSGETTR